MVLLLLPLVAVGGGTTGGVIASRLAQDKSKSILLIEAGENPELNPNIDIPLFADKVRGSEWDWSYRTTPQKHACKSHEDRVRALCQLCTTRMRQIVRSYLHVRTCYMQQLLLLLC